MLIRSCKIINNSPLSENIYSMTFECLEIAGKFKPGQFVTVGISACGIQRLKRPFSIARCKDECVTILYQCVGLNTRALSECTAGMILDVTGPLGNGFKVEHNSNALLISGGVGAASLLALAEELLARGNSEVKLLFGARSANDLALRDFFAEIGLDVFVATDDGSEGLHGYVTELLDDYLMKNKQPDIIYACGPKPMLKEISSQALVKGIESQFCLEAYMACGLGVCMGCAQKIVHDGEEEYLRVCKEGPVFFAKNICWD
ncbi:MAG: dihydroorotate dehydrogenase electron transfer subunit [Candidatus Theseobacter exili]|nr:dihydroorotate dehydrogenase electron transfer subunit [Candidatus Theseobacter exili]